MSEYFDSLNEMKEMEKHPSKFYSEEEKIARGIYCPKCLGSGDKVEIAPGTATCPRCFCREHDLAVDVNVFQKEMERERDVGIIYTVEGIEIGKEYRIDDLAEKFGGRCDAIIGHAIIEGVHLYFLNMKDLGNNGNIGKNITLLSLTNRRNEEIQNIGSDKECIRKFIFNKETSDALGRLKTFENGRVYKYVMTDIKEIKSYGYNGMKRDAIRDMNAVFEEMKIPYKTDNHKEYIKIWRYI